MPKLNISNPEPGIYTGVSESDYRSIKAMNWSSLKRGINENMHAVLDSFNGGESEKTTAKEFGTKTHMAVFEPERYEKLQLINRVQKTTIKENHITSQEKARINLIVLQLKKCFLKYSGKIILSPEFNEIVLLWVECFGSTEVICKARVDNISGVNANDLKTTDEVSEFGFMRSARNFHYGGQAAFYFRGLKANGINVETFNIWSVCKKPPYTTGFISVPMHVIDQWCIVIGRLLNEWVNFIKSPSSIDNSWQCTMPEPDEYLFPELMNV